MAASEQQEINLAERVRVNNVVTFQEFFNTVCQQVMDQVSAEFTPALQGRLLAWYQDYQRVVKTEKGEQEAVVVKDRLADLEAQLDRVGQVIKTQQAALEKVSVIFKWILRICLWFSGNKKALITSRKQQVSDVVGAYVDTSSGDLVSGDGETHRTRSVSLNSVLTRKQRRQQQEIRKRSASLGDGCRGGDGPPGYVSLRS